MFVWNTWKVRPDCQKFRLQLMCVYCSRKIPARSLAWFWNLNWYNTCTYVVILPFDNDYYFSRPTAMHKTKFSCFHGIDGLLLYRRWVTRHSHSCPVGSFLTRRRPSRAWWFPRLSARRAKSIGWQPDCKSPKCFLSEADGNVFYQEFDLCQTPYLIILIFVVVGNFANLDGVTNPIT